MPHKKGLYYKTEPYKLACSLVEAKIIEDVGSGKIRPQPDFKQIPVWAEKAVRHSCEQPDSAKARDSLTRAGVKDEQVTKQLVQAVFGSGQQK